MRDVIENLGFTIIWGMAIYYVIAPCAIALCGGGVEALRVVYNRVEYEDDEEGLDTPVEARSNTW
jgi:hypothetical protein